MNSNDILDFNELAEFVKYIPERDYKSNNYTPYGRPFSDLCKNCDKYYGLLQAKGLVTKFPIQCKRHILNEFKGLVETDFADAAEYNEIMINADPVSWSYAKFGWEARWYQNELMDCLLGNAEVYMSNGTLRKIRDIEVGNSVLTYDEAGRRTFPKTVLTHLNKGIRDVYRISLENGDKVECTSNHEIYSWSKCGATNKMYDAPSYKSSYRSIDSGLAVGDRVFVLNKFANYGNISDLNVAKLLGYLSTDGYVNLSKTKIQFCNTTREYIDEFIQCLNNKFPNDSYSIYERLAHIHNKSKKKTSWTVNVHKGDFSKFLNSIGCTDKTNKELSILDYAFKLSKDSLKVFINRCWSGDGWVYTTESGITELALCSGNKEFLEKYRLLLRKLGIINSKVYNKVNSNTVRLVIRCVDDVITFFDEIGQIFGKEINSDIAITKTDSRIRRTRRRFNTSSRQKIISIEYIGKHEVYDIEVEDRHNFFANGVVVHNCTARRKVVRAGRRLGKTTSIVMLILWMLYTNTNYSILVVAPFQSQVTKIFDEFEKMLSLNSELSAGIKRMTKNPQRLELNNGSKVLGFSSGAKSATKSDKIRGQDANFIVLDEADYLDDADLEAILAILASHPDCGIWASSTPTGAHNKFYMWTVQKQLGFKEFHYIAAESPSWTYEMEHLFRTSWTSIGYEHEFLAEFGIQEGGVFRNDLIDASIEPYKIPRGRQSDNSRVCIGVDWNGEKNGVHIIVTEFWNNKYTVLLKEVTRDGVFTQHSAVQKIVELNAIYNPDFIYVDEGYGRVQVEMLHKYGLQNPGTRLQKKVVPYSMGRNIEIRDPVTSEFISKPAKPFMVNITALQLERGLLTLPHSEDTQVLVNSKDDETTGKQQGLVQQMRNFTVERISVLGRPTYSQGEEHTLTAFMLSIVAFTLEFSDMVRLNFSTKVALFSSANTPKDADKKNEKMAEVTRQLDSGFNSKASMDMSTLFSASRAKKDLRKEISKGNNNAIRRHFGNKNIGRNSKFNNKGRGTI